MFSPAPILTCRELPARVRIEVAQLRRVLALLGGHWIDAPTGEPDSPTTGAMLGRHR
jgi:hypothetical protein